MTMTREEALTIVTSIVREHSRECREPKPCQDCELEAEAIAALSAQGAAPPAQADTKQAEPCPWVRQSSEGTAYCELAESGAKQAKPLRVTREQLGNATVALRNRLLNSRTPQYDLPADSHIEAALTAALHQLGAKVEVSDG